MSAPTRSADLDRSVVGVSPVHRVTLATGPESDSISTDLSAAPSVTGHPVFTSLVHPLPLLTDQGYSPAVLGALRSARLPSTNQVYDSKWRLFAQFCSDRDLDPFSAQPSTVANFLVHVAQNRSSAPSTLATYRSAISRVLLLTTGIDLSSDPILHQLGKSFKRTQPIQSARVPVWDISLVLSVLNSTDSTSLSIKQLTCKTVFLIALASGDRRSAIAALSRPSLRRKDRGVAVDYNKDFVPKSYFLRKNLVRIRSLDLPFIYNAQYNKCCPAATLVHYVYRTDRFRSDSQSSLFISHFEDRTTNIAPQSISYYIKECILWCYEQAGVDCPAVRAHDVRKVAASLRALSATSLEDVLEAGDWSAPSTFLKHYFVNLSPDHSGPRSATIVAGRKSIDFSF